MADVILHGMKALLKLDGAGRIVLPKPLRRHFQLEPGAMLELEVVENGILLHPQGRKAGLVEENGLLVHEGEPGGDLREAVKAVRERRGREVSGPMG